MDGKEKKPVSKGMAWLMVVGGTAVAFAAAFALSRWTDIGRMGRSAQLVFAVIWLAGLIVRGAALCLRKKPVGKPLGLIGDGTMLIANFVLLTCKMTEGA